MGRAEMFRVKQVKHTLSTVGPPPIFKHLTGVTPQDIMQLPPDPNLKSSPDSPSPPPESLLSTPPTGNRLTTSMANPSAPWERTSLVTLYPQTASVDKAGG